MCREMLVLEERELVCVEVKREGKKEGQKRSRGSEKKQGENECGREKKNVWICKRVFACVFVRVAGRCASEQNRDRGRKRQSKTSSRRER